jgi:hypothetical protein
MLNSRNKFVLVSLLTLSMTVFTACSASSPEEVSPKEDTESASTEYETTSGKDASVNENSEEQTPDTENTMEETETDSPSSDSSDDSSQGSAVDSEQPSKEEVNMLLQQLKPDKKVVKTFENKDFSMTETIVDFNDTHVQRVLKVGDMETVQILEWDEEVIRVVYEESNSKNANESKLDDFSPNKEMQAMADIKKKGQGDTSRWEIISENETVKVPYKTFENVVIVQNTVQNGNAKTIHKVYFAPQIGMIKEVYEETGDNGYTVESVLKKAESL